MRETVASLGIAVKDKLRRASLEAGLLGAGVEPTILLRELRVRELRDICGRLGIRRSGRRNDLIRRISDESGLTVSNRRTRTEEVMGHPRFDARAEGTKVVGVSVSTSPARAAVAWGRCDPVGRSVLIEWFRVRDWRPGARRIADLIRRESSPSLITLDAPLGWPSTMGAAIDAHEAGLPVGDMADWASRVLQEADDAQWAEPEMRGSMNRDHSLLDRELTSRRNDLFRRKTDIDIRERFFPDGTGRPFGPPGLDVGADKSGRTAHMALLLLRWLRELTDLPIPLAWEPGVVRETSAIEVSSLVVSQMAPVEWDAIGMMWPKRERPDLSSRDFRAISCFRAGLSFLVGDVQDPGSDLHTAKKEGWIWA